MELALGGLIVGGLSLITPAVWGNGYSVVQSYLLLPPSGALLVGVFICKLLAVLASSGSGAPGGSLPDAVCRPGDGHAVCLLQQAVATGK